MMQLNDRKFNGSLFLCGFMGTGKTTIGQYLAEKLQADFIDLDQEIVKKEGKSIPDIFREGGEPAFRKAEWYRLKEMLPERTGIYALGGGTLQNQHVVDHIKLFGLLIFIETPFDILFERIRNDTSRPMLLDQDGNIKQDNELHSELLDIYHQRQPLYEQAQIKLQREQYASVEELSDDLIKRASRYV
jgi:shikimate kinase